MKKQRYTGTVRVADTYGEFSRNIRFSFQSFFDSNAALGLFSRIEKILEDSNDWAISSIKLTRREHNRNTDVEAPWLLVCELFEKLRATERVSIRKRKLARLR